VALQELPGQCVAGGVASWMTMTPGNQAGSPRTVGRRKNSTSSSSSGWKLRPGGSPMATAALVDMFCWLLVLGLERRAREIVGGEIRARNMM
jgi:hypothetical protein